MSKTLVERLAKIQETLKAPKGQMNKFGGYAYRSCEDILEAVKPLLGGLILTVSDEVVEIGGRVYVKATAKITDGKEVESVSSFAREPQDQKGMNEAQITGSASSYARKYALNGLFLIDDTKDADATNDHGKAPAKSSPIKKADKPEEKKAPSRSARVSKPTEKTEAQEEAPKEEKTTGVRRGDFRKGRRGV